MEERERRKREKKRRVSTSRGIVADEVEAGQRTRHRGPFGREIRV